MVRVLKDKQPDCCYEKAMPRFHHIQVRSSDPEAATAFYADLFPSTSAGHWGGYAALFSPNDAMILFERDDDVPAGPQSALWHFGWHVQDSRKTTAEFIDTGKATSAPLFTGDGDGQVPISSDTWFMTDDTLGVSKARIAEMKATGTPPPGGWGFAYFTGPDGVLFEIIGDKDQERFDHVHMWHEEPLCAQLWYQKHFGFPPRGKFGEVPGGEAACKVPRAAERTFPALNPEGMFRTPPGGVMVGDIALTWYPNQGETPLAPSRGQRLDHIAFAVEDLDAWALKFREAGTTFLEDGLVFGESCAVMIEGPSREAIMLVGTG
jgi:catechol 2,3-dioxygenase-like lactoylglutathione lyase family enzyme